MIIDSWIGCHRFFFLFFFIKNIEFSHEFFPQNFFHKKVITPWIVPRVFGQPHSAHESTKMRSLHQRGRETKKFLFHSSSCLCLMGWGSSSLEILQICSCADWGSSQLGTPVANRCCRGFLEVYRVITMRLNWKLFSLSKLHEDWAIQKLHGSHHSWMSWPLLDKGNLLQPSSVSTRESENSWTGLWFHASSGGSFEWQLKPWDSQLTVWSL